MKCHLTLETAPFLLPFYNYGDSLATTDTKCSKSPDLPFAFSSHAIS